MASRLQPVMVAFDQTELAEPPVAERITGIQQHPCGLRYLGRCQCEMLWLRALLWAMRRGSR
jgi:hypothetical protein